MACDARGSATNARFRLLGHLDLGEQALVVASQPGNSMPAALRTRLRPPSHPTRYCALSDWPSDSVDVDAGVVLREAGHFASAVERHRQLADPAGEDALDVLLPEREPVVVPGGKVADVQAGGAEPRDLSHLPLRRGTDRRFRADRGPRWCVTQTACARAGEVLAGAPLDDGDVDARQRQLARQHQPRRTASGDHHRMLGHRNSSRPLDSGYDGDRSRGRSASVDSVLNTPVHS